MHLACRVRTADADGRSDFQPNRRYTRNTITMEASIGGSWTLRPMVSSNPVLLERNPINPRNPDTLKFAPFELLYLSHGNRTCCLSLVFCAGAHTASRRRDGRSGPVAAAAAAVPFQRTFLKCGLLRKNHSVAVSANFVVRTQNSVFQCNGSVHYQLHTSLGRNLTKVLSHSHKNCQMQAPNPLQSHNILPARKSCSFIRFMPPLPPSRTANPLLAQSATWRPTATATAR